MAMRERHNNSTKRHLATVNFTRSEPRNRRYRTKNYQHQLTTLTSGVWRPVILPLAFQIVKPVEEMGKRDHSKDVANLHV